MIKILETLSHGIILFLGQSITVHTTVLQVWAYTILQGYGYMQPHPPQTKLKLVTLSLSILDFEKNITVEIFKYKMF